MIEPNDFSYNRFKSLLLSLKEKGFKDIFFKEEEGCHEKFVLWRHDVDVDLEAAFKLSKIEVELGIKSTYFFMINSWFYNLFSQEGIRFVQQIVGMGHQVGLHCDLQLDRYAVVDSDMVEQCVNRDFYVIEKFFDKNTFQRVVSFHNPPSLVLKRSFTSFYSTYQEKFFGKIKYLSDSNRIWREGPPEQWVNGKSQNCFSILLHPIIWGTTGQTMPEAVESFLVSRKDDLFNKLDKDDVIVR